ncbi:hypothetical protein D3C80_1486210 [compost metagenome]
MAQQRFQRQISLIEIGDAGMTVKMKRRCGCRHHGEINESGNRHRNTHIPFGCRIAFLPGAIMRILRQRRVEIDNMRHDRRAQNTGCQKHSFRGWQAGYCHTFAQLHQIRLRKHELNDIRCRNE